MHWVRHIDFDMVRIGHMARQLSDVLDDGPRNSMRSDMPRDPGPADSTQLCVVPRANRARAPFVTSSDLFAICHDTILHESVLSVNKNVHAIPGQRPM